MKENKYSEKVTEYLNGVGAIVDNNTASIYARVGRSDLTVLYKGYYLALELKTGNYKPTDLQIAYLHKIREAGGIGLILRDNLIEIKNVIKQIDKAEIMGTTLQSIYKQPELPKYNDIQIVFD